mmetsp:Transcript_5867/g.12764  ORF Transcript_5867/g.12764 Transcript_5867/m.12764 type:complete len:204 (-) Transcript_5867:670-1281(-)
MTASGIPLPKCSKALKPSATMDTFIPAACRAPRRVSACVWSASMMRTSSVASRFTFSITSFSASSSSPPPPPAWVAPPRPFILSFCAASFLFLSIASLAHSGKRKKNSDPSPFTEVAQTFPPCCLATSWATVRPTPSPSYFRSLWSSSSCSNAPKIRTSASSAMPMPVSLTETSKPCGSDLVLTTTLPFGVNLHALSTMCFKA